MRWFFDAKIAAPGEAKTLFHLIADVKNTEGIAFAISRQRMHDFFEKADEIWEEVADKVAAFKKYHLTLSINPLIYPDEEYQDRLIILTYKNQCIDRFWLSWIAKTFLEWSDLMNDLLMLRFLTCILSIFKHTYIFSTGKNFFLINGVTKEVLLDFGLNVSTLITPCSTFKIFLNNNLVNMSATLKRR